MPFREQTVQTVQIFCVKKGKNCLKIFLKKKCAIPWKILNYTTFWYSKSEMLLNFFSVVFSDIKMVAKSTRVYCTRAPKLEGPLCPAFPYVIYFWPPYHIISYFLCISPSYTRVCKKKNKKKWNCKSHWFTCLNVNLKCRMLFFYWNSPPIVYSGPPITLTIIRWPPPPH